MEGNRRRGCEKADHEHTSGYFLENYSINEFQTQLSSTDVLEVLFPVQIFHSVHNDTVVLQKAEYVQTQ